MPDPASSAADLTAFLCSAVYSATKWAIDDLMEVLRMESLCIS